jgi:hypothetical protein
VDEWAQIEGATCETVHREVHLGRKTARRSACGKDARASTLARRLREALSVVAHYGTHHPRDWFVRGLGSLQTFDTVYRNVEHACRRRAARERVPLRVVFLFRRPLYECRDARSLSVNDSRKVLALSSSEALLDARFPDERAGPCVHRERLQFSPGQIYFSLGRRSLVLPRKPSKMLVRRPQAYVPGGRDEREES